MLMKIGLEQVAQCHPPWVVIIVGYVALWEFASQVSECRKGDWQTSLAAVFWNPSQYLGQGYASHRLLPEYWVFLGDVGLLYPAILTEVSLTAKLP